MLLDRCPALLNRRGGGMGYNPLRKPIDAVMDTVLIGLGTRLCADR